MKSLRTIAAMIVFAALTGGVQAQTLTVEKKALTLDGAKKVMAAATAFIKQNNTTGVIAIVDDGGNLIDFTKLSRYEVSLLNNVARVLSLLSSLRNSGLLSGGSKEGPRTRRRIS